MMGISNQDKWYLDALPVGARADIDGTMFVKDVNGEWVEEPVKAVEELLAEDKWQDVEGMRFGMHIVLGCVALFVVTGSVLGLVVGFGISFFTGKMF